MGFGNCAVFTKIQLSLNKTIFSLKQFLKLSNISWIKFSFLITDLT